MGFLVIPSRMLKRLSKRRLLQRELALPSQKIYHSELGPSNTGPKLRLYLLPLVENLHPHERVEDERGDLSILHVLVVSRKHPLPTKVQQVCNSKLVERLSKNHLPHCDGNDWRATRLWLTVQNGWVRRIL